MSGLVTIELTRSVELARSVERARSVHIDCGCAPRTMFRRVSAMINPWADPHGCI